MYIYHDCESHEFPSLTLGLYRNVFQLFILPLYPIILITGHANSSEEETVHWKQMLESTGEQVCGWHVLLEPWFEHFLLHWSLTRNLPIAYLQLLPEPMARFFRLLHFISFFNNVESLQNSFSYWILSLFADGYLWYFVSAYVACISQTANYVDW